MKNSAKWLVLSAFAVSLGAAIPAHAESAGQYIDDATITTKVKAALMGDSQLKATQVSVQTDQGIVQLSGAVDTKGQESEAVNAASKVNGVKSVKDMITVKGSSDSKSNETPAPRGQY